MTQQSPLVKWIVNPRNWLLLLGLGITAGALLGDVILNGTKIGVGPLQLIVASVGIALVILSRLTYSALQGSMVSLISVIVMIVIFEVVLIMLGFPTDAPPPQIDMETIDTFEYAPSRICDETMGCRFVQDVVMVQCEERSNPANLLCGTNAEGFNNPEDFTAENVADADYRILVLGDSFTWGASANIGLGWVDVMRDELQATYENVEIWNAAIPGTGTHQAILTASSLLPIMQPDLVILGFHTGNDLVDNLYPYDRFIFVADEDGNAINVQQYSLRQDGTVIQETPQIIHYRSLGYQVSSIEPTTSGQVLGLLQHTRIGTLVIGAFNVFNRANYQLEPTVNALTELQALVSENDAQFLVMIAPEQNDTISPTVNFLNAVTAFEQVSIPYVNPTDLLSPDDFENPNPTDKHWNAEGQAIAGGLMVECVSYMIENDWRICPIALNQ